MITGECSLVIQSSPLPLPSFSSSFFLFSFSFSFSSFFFSSSLSFFRYNSHTITFIILYIHKVVCCMRSVTKLCLTLCNPVDCSTPGFPVLHYILELAQTRVHRVGDVSNHLILCHPLLLLPSIFPSIRVFSNKSVLHIRWPEAWSFSFSISPSNAYSGLISFRMDWFDLLLSKGLSRVSSPAQQFKSTNFLVPSLLYPYQPISHPHMNAGKTIALTTWISVSKVMSLLCHTLSGFVTRLCIYLSLWHFHHSQKNPMLIISVAS